MTTPLPAAREGDPVLVVRGLAKRYHGRRVLDDLDFDLRHDECLVVLGRSGSGKSVMLRHLNGLEQPDAGSIRIGGLEMVGLDEHELAPIRRHVAMLFQSGALFDSMTVAENIGFPFVVQGELGPEEIAAKVVELLGKVGLPGIESKLPADLSGGMRKRVALARALALEPRVLLFDEPTTGLDPMTAASIARLLRDTRRATRAAALVVTHDLALARHVADRIAFLHGGRFRFVGTFAEAEASGDSMLSDFLAGREETEDAA
jgi:phospholipid/cholesterol/gamma-HCH transport system ATP-binding protein